MPPNLRNMGMVFQSYALFPNMTVFQNVAFGLRMRRMSGPDMHKRVNNVLEMVRLGDTAERFPHQISGGQQQRVALARALAAQPRVLLLDEPLSALDAEVRVVLRGEIRRIQSESGITTIYVTHDQEEALSISDEVVVMNRGIIQQVGSPQQIYRHPVNRFVATFIGTANQLFGMVDGEHVVTSNGLHLRSGVMQTFRQKQSVVLLIRPEHIKVTNTQPQKNDWNIIQGQIETITFHGALTRLGVNINNHRVVADTTAANAEPFILNQKIWLSFPPGACQVMDQSV